MYLLFNAFRTLLITVMITGSVIINSCAFEKGCDEQVDFPVNTTFYYEREGIENDTILEGVSLFGVGREDSLLFDKDTVSSISFRLSPFADHTEMVLIYGVLKDTLGFDYGREMKMISPSCGFAYLFDVNNIVYTGNFIDSVYLTDPKLESFEAEHLKIFIH